MSIIFILHCSWLRKRHDKQLNNPNGPCDWYSIFFFSSVDLLQDEKKKISSTSELKKEILSFDVTSILRLESKTNSETELNGYSILPFPRRRMTCFVILSGKTSTERNKTQVANCGFTLHDRGQDLASHGPCVHTHRAWRRNTSINNKIQKCTFTHC